VNCNGVALNKGQWPAIVNMVMKLRSAHIGEFPTKQATIGFSKETQWIELRT